MSPLGASVYGALATARVGDPVLDEGQALARANGVLSILVHFSVIRGYSELRIWPDGGPVQWLKEAGDLSVMVQTSFPFGQAVLFRFPLPWLMPWMIDIVEVMES